MWDNFKTNWVSWTIIALSTAIAWGNLSATVGEIQSRQDRFETTQQQQYEQIMRKLDSIEEYLRNTK